VAYAELEAEIFPARTTHKRKVESAVLDADGQVLATVSSPDRANLVVRWSRGLGGEERQALVSALNDFLGNWSREHALAAKESPKALKKKKK